MPELPEVEAVRLLMEKNCMGKRVRVVSPFEQGGGARNGQFDDIVMGEGANAASITAAFGQRNVKALHRRGKQIWFELSGEGPSILFHLGMTGTVVLEGHDVMKYKAFKVDETFPPRFTKLLVEFEGGLRLAFADPRRLGRICLRNDPLNTSPIKDLAPDALLAPPAVAAFSAALQPVTCAVKALLLDQNRVVSGVGNWIADEVCYQARVHPATNCNTLSEAQLASLHSALVDVVKTAVACCSTTSSFPASYLFHYRWSKGKKGSSSKGPQDAEGAAITFENVGGRTSAVVLSRQFKGKRIVVASSSTKVEPKSHDRTCTTCFAVISARSKVMVCKKCKSAIKSSRGAEVISTEEEMSTPSTLPVAVEKSLPRTAARSRSKVKEEVRQVETEIDAVKKKGSAKSQDKLTIKKGSVGTLDKPTTRGRTTKIEDKLSKNKPPVARQDNAALKRDNAKKEDKPEKRARAVNSDEKQAAKKRRTVQ